ncbi:MAG: hypothetical protein ACMV1D_04715 [Macromonas sp.]
MNNRQFLLLVGAIYIAPNVSQFVALAIAGLATILAFAVKD